MLQTLEKTLVESEICTDEGTFFDTIVLRGLNRAHVYDNSPNI